MRYSIDSFSCTHDTCVNWDAQACIPLYRRTHSGSCCSCSLGIKKKSWDGLLMCIRRSSEMGHCLHCLQLLIYNSNFVAFQSPAHGTHMFLYLGHCLASWYWHCTCRVPSTSNLLAPWTDTKRLLSQGYTHVTVHTTMSGNNEHSVLHSLPAAFCWVDLQQLIDITDFFRICEDSTCSETKTCMGVVDAQ